jgi:DNA-binding CsgD family transcriptional regulator
MNLTKKEKEIYGYLLEGKNQKQIAEDLVVSPRTVATHIRRIFRKTDSHSKTDLMARRIKELEELVDELIRTTDRAGKENDPLFYK